MKLPQQLGLILLFIGLSGCATKAPVNTEPELPMSPLVATYWELTKINGEKVDYAEGQKIPYVHLSPEQRLAGYSGCNRLMGEFEQSKAWLHFSGVATTRMMCAPQAMNLEAAVLEGLNATAVYRLGRGKLQLIDYRSRVILEFAAVP
jgi:heat shock protein HslJ